MRKHRGEWILVNKSELCLSHNISGYMSVHNTVVQHHNYVPGGKQVPEFKIQNKHGHTHLSTHLNADLSFIFKITFVTHQQCGDIITILIK